MDKRFLLAIALSAVVLVATPLIFPTGQPTTPPADSARAVAGATTGAAGAAVGTGATTPSTAPGTTAATVPAAVSAPVASGDTTRPAAVAPVVAETATVTAGRSIYRFTSPGAAPVAVTLADFPDLQRKGSPLTLASERSPLVRYRLVLGADTVDLNALPTTRAGSGQPGGPVVYEAAHAGHRIRIENSFPADYQVRVRGEVQNAPAGAVLLVELPQGLRSREANVADDLHSLAFSYKPLRDDPQGIKFGSLDSGVTRVDAGPIKWVALRNKYFLTAVIAEAPTAEFREFRTSPGPEINGIVREASGVGVLPLANGRWDFTFVAGPQKARFLRALGNDLENVNPYGGWLHGMVQPLATIVNNVLLWLKDTTNLNYGWVLIIFGIIVRLAMWPLQQSAMRNSMKMQRLQPELQEIQKKYGRDPEKQREAMMKLYASHGMSPFSPMMGCLPMMLPMPVLFALYFVFQNTTEFRGVPFWWLSDISLKDPYYIIPIFMGLTMLLLSWLGMRGAPPNPQAKVMGYMMPAMMTVLFLNFPSGLNLSYAVQNVAAMPQQWLLSRERARAEKTAPAPKTGGGGAPATVRRAKQ